MSSNPSSLRSALSTARGLGSAKDGTAHWWMQRVTALVMIPLMVWFVYSFIGQFVGGTRESVAAWFASPIHAIALLILLSAMFYHAKLGLQVVVEDYVHCHSKKLILLIGMKIAFFALAAMSWVAILKLHIVGI